ncbi:hypothetical protein HBI42_187370 [Parastagonospora nodorum]|nr:hypothetical protein HBI43_182400 [Parastagonospora nodorum]KAH6246942.1 hypothetical protein HBI42_187370 [Parastagonospora nodorum]
MRSSIALPPIKRAQLRYASSNKETPALLRTNAYRSVFAQLMLDARIEVIAAYALNYLKLQFLSANIIALIGIVLYNAIKEYYDNRTRKIIYFYSYTIETIYANYIKNSRSNVTVLDNYHDNNVNNILIKCTDNKQQRYNILIEDYNRTEKREDNILTIDKCRTSYSNKKDIEANEKEEETRVRLRKLSREIYDILLREFREANNFTESVTHNDNKQIAQLELEDCDALVERYKEEINCSNLYSTV